MGLKKSPLLVFLKPEDVEQGDDPQGLVDFARRVKQIGYSGFLLWDTDLSKPTIEGYVRRQYDLLSSWAADNDFSLVAEVCPTNETIEQWWHVAGATEQGSVGGRRYVCLAEPAVHDVYEKIVDNVLQVFPKGSPLVGLMAYYDEHRLSGTHARCHVPAGPLLAAHMRKTFDIFRAKAPHLRPCAWSDMLSPVENARTPYYSAYGGMKGAEAALAPDLWIMNWDTAGDSIKPAFAYFAGKGNEQCYMGYYDGPDGDGMSAADERRAIREVQKLPGVIGYGYTSWQANFDHLKEYLTKDGWDTPGGVVTPPPPLPEKWAPCPACVGHAPPYPAGKVPA